MPLQAVPSSDHSSLLKISSKPLTSCLKGNKIWEDSTHSRQQGPFFSKCLCGIGFVSISSHSA